MEGSRCDRMELEPHLSVGIKPRMFSDVLLLWPDALTSTQCPGSERSLLLLKTALCWAWPPDSLFVWGVWRAGVNIIYAVVALQVVRILPHFDLLLGVLG